jgi:hypothetical protein
MISSKSLQDTLPRYIGNSVHVGDIFDPRQTHAVYGLCENTLPLCKEHLKKLGASAFRTVRCKNGQGKPSGLLILCFNSKKITL